MKIGLVRAYMDWICLGVHKGVMAGSNACNAVHGMPFAARRGGVEDVGVGAHNLVFRFYR